MTLWKENNFLLKEEIEEYSSENIDFSRLKKELLSFSQKECSKYFALNSSNSKVVHYGDEDVLDGFATLIGGTAINRLFGCGNEGGLLGEEWHNSPTYNEVLSLCKQFISEYYEVCKNSILCNSELSRMDALNLIGEEYGFSVDTIFNKSKDNIDFKELYNRYVADYDTIFDYEDSSIPYPVDSDFKIQEIREYFNNTVLYVRYNNIYYNIDDLLNLMKKYVRAFKNLTGGICS